MLSTKGDYKPYVQYLMKHKKDFFLNKTSGTTVVKEFNRPSRMYYTDEIFDNKDFGFIARLKSEIRKSKAFGDLKKNIDLMEVLGLREKIIINRNPSDNIITFGTSPLSIRYFEFNDSLYDLDFDNGACYTYENVVECDITKAYYKSAEQLGVISNSFYKECAKLDKSKRLKMMGSIATNTTCYEYKAGKVNLCYVKNDPYMRALWFSICRYVDQCMLDVKNMLDKKDFIFYWVDGIYFEETKNLKNVRLVNSIMDTYGFEYVSYHLKKMYVENRNGDIVLSVVKPDKKDPLEFNVPKKKVRGYYFGNPADKYEVMGEKIFC